MAGMHLFPALLIFAQLISAALPMSSFLKGNKYNLVPTRTIAPGVDMPVVSLGVKTRYFSLVWLFIGCYDINFV
jgi:hypothetical protein